MMYDDEVTQMRGITGWPEIQTNKGIARGAVPMI